MKLNTHFISSLFTIWVYQQRYSYTLINRFSSNCPFNNLSSSTSILNYRNQMSMTLTNSTFLVGRKYTGL